MTYQHLVDQLKRPCGNHPDFAPDLLLAIPQRCGLANRHFHDHAAQKQIEAHLIQDSTNHELLLLRALHQLYFQSKLLASLPFANAQPRRHLHRVRQLARQLRRQEHLLLALQVLSPHLLAPKFHPALLPSHLCP